LPQHFGCSNIQVESLNNKSRTSIFAIKSEQLDQEITHSNLINDKVRFIQIAMEQMLGVMILPDWSIGPNLNSTRLHPKKKGMKKAERPRDLEL